MSALQVVKNPMSLMELNDLERKVLAALNVFISNMPAASGVDQVSANHAAGFSFKEA